MKIYANEFEGETRVSLSAENEAEKHQIKFIVSELSLSGADFGEWKSFEEVEGVTLKLINKP